MENLLKQLQHHVATSRARYARLVLVVGKHGCGKSQLLRDFADYVQVSPINVGSQLPPILFELPSKQRAVSAADRLGDLIRDNDDTAIVDNIELLFHPQLSLDPLKLFQDNARNRVVVVAWPGTSEGNELTFGGSGHPEFRSYTSPDALVLAL